MTTPQVKCVIFDCDGTLVDSERLCCEALCQVFNQFGAKLSIEDAISHFEGGKLADILVKTKQRLGINVSIDKLEPIYREYIENLFETQLKPMEGVFELLSYLESQGIEYCVVSNGPRTKIEKALKLTGLYPYFRGKIFSAFEANSWKPEPDIVMYSAMNMGFRLAECLYVDDTPRGLEAGVRAGVKTVQLIGLNERSHTLNLEKIRDLRELEHCV